MEPGFNINVVNTNIKSIVMYTRNFLLSLKVKQTEASRAASRVHGGVQKANILVLAALTAVRGSTPPAPQDPRRGRPSVEGSCDGGLHSRRRIPTYFPPAQDIHTHLNPAHLTPPRSTCRQLLAPGPPLQARHWTALAHTENHLLSYHSTTHTALHQRTYKVITASFRKPPTCLPACLSSCLVRTLLTLQGET
ncbi:hypothetical protein E2C01_085177 [Portunus trituberculatus]|uniref:Uncharacterized protein n=1 Tax=Portunus trituberculatus TaxID=210409 RepID=A0A5B7J6W8_PORTR|nr:hypothetical protein [Portunus trituberculatus]